MTKESIQDVLIVGGGMVGTSLALSLAPLGLKVTLVEGSPPAAIQAPGYDDRATALSLGSKRILDAIGLWSGLEPYAEAIQRVHVSEAGRFGVAWLDACELSVEALGWVVENPRLLAALQTALDSEARLSVLQPATVTAVQQDEECVEVTVNVDGATRTLRTRLLVGADGARSSIRDMAGIGCQRNDYGQSAIVANLSPHQPHCGVAWERFTPAGPLAFLPLTEGRCAIVWTVATAEADAVLALSDHHFAGRINALFGERLGPIDRVGRRQMWPLQRMQSDQHRAGRIVLVGNAAHSLHPIAGQGFNLSLRDCAALAEHIAEAVHASGDPACGRFLDSWEKARHADQKRVGQFTDGLNRLFVFDLPFVALARGVGIGMFGLAGPARRLLARYGAGIGARLR